MKIEEMTDAQIADYLRKFEFQRYNQLEKVTKEQAKLKKLKLKFRSLKQKEMLETAENS